MKLIVQVYRFLNLISVDVACGAVVCAGFFARLYHVEPKPAGLLALGISVWIIYSADHLMDAHSLGREASTQRHRFHQKHFRPVMILLVFATVIDFILIFYIRKPVLMWGLVLMAFIVPYLIFHKHTHPFKELLVSVFYSGGVLLLALSLHTHPVSLTVKLLVVTFVITALLNLLIFSWFEWDQDQKDKRASFVTRLGRQNTKRVIWALYAIQLTIFLLVLLKGTNQLELLSIVSMNVILLVIFIYPRRFMDADRYRLVGDFVFLLPLLHIFWK